jgi:hypothetical protein
MAFLVACVEDYQDADEHRNGLILKNKGNQQGYAGYTG